MIRIQLICLFVCLFECVCRVLSCLSVSESIRETKAQHTQHPETPCCGCDWLVGWLAFQCLFVCLFVLDIWFFPFFSPPSCRKTKAKKQTKAKKEKQRSKEAKKRYSLSIMSSEPPSSSTGDPPVVASSLPPPPPPPPSSSSSEVVVVVGGGSGGVTQPPKEQKKKPENLVIPPPKPKLSKAERRALQEQQRAAKAAAGKGGAQQGLAVAVAGTGGAGAVAVAGTGAGTGQPKAPPAAAAAAATATTTTGASSSSPKAETTVPTPSLMTSTSNRGYFSHLSPYRDPHQTFWIGPIPSPQQLTTTTFTTSSSSSSSFLFPALHPAVIDLGRRYAAGIAAPSGTHPHHRSPAPIRGGNARCRAMLECYQRLLRDGVPPPPPPPPPVSSSPPVDVRHYVEQAILKAPFQYWTTECRPHSVSMGNALSVLKTAVASIPRDECTWERIVPTLHETISLYWHERIVFADKAIADLAVAKLLLQPRHDDHGPRSWSVTSKEQQETMTTTTTSGRLADDDDEEEEEEEEVIVTYGRSQVVAQILIQAAATLQQQHQQHQQQQQQQQRRRRRRRHLRVIVVDSRPLLEGRELLQELRSAGIDCTYILLNGLTYVLQDKPSKVLLGASAVMSDGSILGRVGTASVALAASAQKIPVLVCCETYKISNRVQLESITHNELGNPEQVMSSSSSSSLSSLKALNLLYDLTPAALVSGIVTELGIVPPTSIAVLLREMNNPHSSTSSSTVSNPAPAATPVH